MPDKIDEAPKHVLHWPAEGIEHGESSGGGIPTEGPARSLAMLGGVTAQFVQLLLFGVVSILGYGWLVDAGVITGGTTLAGITLVAGVYAVVDVALDRLIVSPIQAVSAFVAIVVVLPLVVAATLLGGDRTLFSTVARGIVAAPKRLSGALLG
jgi:NADPH-dependent 2,4-dienoyl-CoA reductase/sulfur reductase-like enzyme